MIAAVQLCGIVLKQVFELKQEDDAFKALLRANVGMHCPAFRASGGRGATQIFKNTFGIFFHVQM